LLNKLTIKLLLKNLAIKKLLNNLAIEKLLNEMKITIGVPATNDNFYPRAKEIDRIYRSLADGNNIYLSAPRRVGKTSIMRHLQDNPKAGFTFVYGDFEACKSIAEFFSKLINCILVSPAKQKLGSKINEKVKAVAKRFESLNLEGYGLKLETKTRSSIDWVEEVKGLMQDLKLAEGRLVIMIDEFPQVVLNLLQHVDEAEAAHFLHIHRQLRQQKQGLAHLSFIYTGSISLNHAVSQAADLKTVNDFEFIAVEPLDRQEGLKFARQIIAEYELPIADLQLESLIDRIEWLVPFHIQLIMKEVRELSISQSPGSASIIDQAFENLLQLQNKPHFDHYFSRLPKAFKDQERRFVSRALSLASGTTPPTYAILANEANQAGCMERCAEILETLEIDGYLVQHNASSTYLFRSPILKAWWNRHERKKHE
jgi:uncharacterized protein